MHFVHLSALEKYLFGSSDYFLTGFFFFFDNVELPMLFVYLGYQSFVDLFICKHFLLFRGLSFHFFFKVSFVV